MILLVGLFLRELARELNGSWTSCTGRGGSCLTAGTEGARPCDGGRDPGLEGGFEGGLGLGGADGGREPDSWLPPAASAPSGVEPTAAEGKGSSVAGSAE